MAETHHNRRTKSSVLSNLPFIHKRTSSAGTALSGNFAHNLIIHSNLEDISCFSSEHPRSKPLVERHQIRSRQSAVQPDTPRGGPKSLDKKTLSSVSLKSLSKKDAFKVSDQTPPKSTKMIKTKSSTNLANLLSRPKSFVNLKKEATEIETPKEKNKENNPPTESSEKSQPPTYTRYLSNHLTRNEHEGKILENEIDLYTPKNYSPGKQRNFCQTGNRPTLANRDGTTHRPRSTYLPSTFNLQEIGRRVSSGSRSSAELIRRVSGRTASYERNNSTPIPKSEKSQRPNQNRGQRVLAAVSLSFGPKPVKATDEPSERLIGENDINKEFEAMLDRRNIPDHQRGKMRSLALSLKKDFIRQDWAEIAASKSIRPEATDIDTHCHDITGQQDVPELNAKRPRSRTFTLTRGAIKDLNIPPKKIIGEITLGKVSRKKSSENIGGGTKSFTAAGAAAAQNIIAKAKGQTSDDFVSYLRKVTKPELVEVGRLHKLRLLLRNETVAWTDDFIQKGGMQEIFALLHRIMAVEWREEHEDTLLHEVLLCLKGLSTTALALKQIDNTQTTLFPALLHMLFDEDKKGPSEFTTRNIITSLLFTYLKSAPLSEREKRAKTVLSYLRDPEPVESQRPVGFVLEMRRPRPYRVWCKEVVNVTKEVFWIFLHNLNVIALPVSRCGTGDDHGTITPTDSSFYSEDTPNSSYKYIERHFPQERPPIPAAPYVGGVEWDATNYLASHLDLVNGIIACISSREDRNLLRGEMSISGWEKCMGGTLRLCKEKFYVGVHAGLRSWVAAATEDGWDTKCVRCGPCTETKSKAPVTSPKKENPTAPKIALDFLDNHNVGAKAQGVSAWL